MPDASVLSSDLLEAQFGPTELLVLHDDGMERVIGTNSASGQHLELSLVRFRIEMSRAHPAVWRQLQAGSSMGAAFRQAGFDFQRTDQQAYQLRLPEPLSQWFGSLAPATVIQLVVVANTQPLADVFEIYHPEVRWPLPIQPGRPKGLTPLLDQLQRIITQ